jgi:hypothetical protein
MHYTRAVAFGLALFCAPLAAEAQTAIMPLNTQGCATMQLTTASKAISAANVTVLPNSAYPGSNFGLSFYVEADYSNTQNIIFCPMGGTCSISAGVTMGAGGSRTMRIPFVTTPPTVIAASGTQQVFVCWLAQ